MLSVVVDLIGQCYSMLSVGVDMIGQCYSMLSVRRGFDWSMLFGICPTLRTLQVRKQTEKHTELMGISMKYRRIFDVC